MKLKRQDLIAEYVKGGVAVEFLITVLNAITLTALLAADFVITFS